MANRGIFLAKETKPFCVLYHVDFAWNKGLSKSQMRKNVVALHESYNKIKPTEKLLEISSASDDENGVKLSAFNLPVTIDGRTVCVEQAFQSGKVFEKAGPLPELLDYSSKDAKKFVKTHDFGSVIGFELNGCKYPIEPKTAFYDWIYINALVQNEDLSKYILNFDGFTDIYFNEAKQINCQARSCAYYVALVRTGKLEEAMKSFEDFVKVIY